MCAHSSISGFRGVGEGERVGKGGFSGHKEKIKGGENLRFFL